jgi:NADPH2:quinone reductase
LGADVAIDYRSADFVKEARAECPDGVDVVFDLIGGEAQSHSYEALRPGGVLVSIVAPPDEDEAAKHDARGAWCFVEPNGGQLRQIAELLEANAVRPAQTESLPLAEAAAAQERNRDGHVRGKLVLRVG